MYCRIVFDKALTLFESFDDLVVSEISQLQPNFRATATSTLNATASLLIFPRIGFSDLKILQDYRDKSILKGFSSVGGLWTALALFFGALFGSSLVRVVFGKFCRPHLILFRNTCVGRPEASLCLWTCTYVNRLHAAEVQR